MWYSGRRIPVARVQSFLKTFKLETHYRCRWVARAQQHVCAVTMVDRSVAGSLSLKSLEHVKSLSRWPEILNMEEALINTYRMYTVLCDMTLKDYKNEKMKLNVWEKIAEELHFTKEDALETRQKSLLYVFVQFLHSPGKWNHCILGIMKMIML